MLTIAPPGKLTLRQVETLTGYEQSSIYGFIRKKGFPKPTKLPQRREKVWDEAEVRAWLEAREAARGGS